MAQPITDTLLLKEFEISAPRLTTFGTGSKVQRMDSATMVRYASADLGALLANESPIFIKSYGLGSLATTSFRGGSANHTAVLWNGISISSAMNGQIDLSLIPVGAANEVSVQYGGSTALWGSGAVGGAIHLNSVPRFLRGVQVDGSLAFGSFGDRRQNVRAEVSKERWITSIALYNADARNDFTYRVGPASARTDRTQTNAALQRQGLLFEQYLRTGARGLLGVRYWYQQANRRIPPTRLQAFSTAQQVDASHRVMADWRYEIAKWGTTLRGGWTDERLDWYASTDAENGLSRSQVLVGEAELNYRPEGPHTLDLGLHHTHAQARTDGYLHNSTQDRSALFTLYRYRPGTHFTGTVSARQEWLDGSAVPFTGSVGAEYRLKQWAVLKAQAARVYRVPTFNDLYWNPGGNPALLPEDGYSGDLGVLLRHTWRRYAFRSEVTWFNRMLHNWIIWLPGPAYWSPQNIMQVWSRGVESDSEIAWKAGGATVKLGMMTNQVVSTNQVAKSHYDDSVDRQLIYVPMYSGNGRLGVARGRGSFTVHATYTGYRYTSTDNREYLEPYWLLNASASLCAVRQARWQTDVFVHANNLLGTEYEVMLSRPMPLRNFQAGLRVHFDRPNPPKPITP